MGMPCSPWSVFLATAMVVPTPVATGVVRRLVSDDEYIGYHIPAGSTVVASIWYIVHVSETRHIVIVSSRRTLSRDERVYPDAEAFRPERFHNLDRATAEYMDPRNYVFGFGRRICPGLLISDSSIWLAIADIIATSDIAKCRDASSKITTPVAAWESGLVSQPVSYTVEIRPRSEQSAKLIQQINDSAIL